MRKHFADGFVNRQIRAGIRLRRGLVYQNQMLSAKIVDQAGGWINYERRSADYQRVGCGDCLDRAVQSFVVQAFFIQNYVRLYECAAFFAARQFVGRGFALRDEINVVKFAALHAKIPQGRAVQFENIFASRHLMQAVDVLRDYSFQFSCRFKLGELQMRGVRLRVFDDEFFAIKSVKFRGIRVEKRAAYYDFGREFPLLAVKSVLASEVGNAAFGGNARAAEKNDVLGFVDEILQSANLIFHKKIVQNFREIFNTHLAKRSKPQRFSSKTSSVFAQNLKGFG